jgi:hypothetical protein
MVSFDPAHQAATLPGETPLPDVSVRHPGGRRAGGRFLPGGSTAVGGCQVLAVRAVRKGISRAEVFESANLRERL